MCSAAMVRLLREVGDGARDAQHAVIGARREQQARERVAQQLVALAVGGAMPVDLARAEQRVGLALARELQPPRALDALADRCRGLAGDRRDQLGLARRRHLELEVDAVGSGPEMRPR